MDEKVDSKTSTPSPSHEPLHLTSEEYTNISTSPEFKGLIKKKFNFIVPMTIFFLIFYFALPFLTSYTHVLHHKAIGDITWVWIFAFAQFIMVWTLVTIYVSKSNKYDIVAEEIITKAKDGDYK